MHEKSIVRNTLILGGTGWLGRHIAAQALERGDAVTCLARGESGDVPPGATLVRADRRAPGAYNDVAGRDWDEVIEISYEADLVTGALDALARWASHWTLVSTVSVYADADEPGADEGADVLEPAADGAYGQVKVAAERASAAVIGDRLLIVRAGLIVGPGDTTDRFGYWASRFALAAGEGTGDAVATVLTPPVADRCVQVIDVRDLASWIVSAGAAEKMGVFNATGDVHSLAETVEAAATIAGFTGETIEAPEDWLIERDVSYWSGPRSLPLWLPAADVGFAQRSNSRFLEADGHLRSLTETLEATLAFERERGLGRSRKAGLTRDEELALLGELHAVEQSSRRG